MHPLTMVGCQSMCAAGCVRRSASVWVVVLKAVRAVVNLWHLHRWPPVGACMRRPYVGICHVISSARVGGCRSPTGEHAHALTAELYYLSRSVCIRTFFPLSRALARSVCTTGVMLTMLVKL